MKEQLLKDAFAYLNTQRTGVIALEMPDGSPHAATVHFAYKQDPFSFVFLTDRYYRKGEALMARDSVRASLVIGTIEIISGDRTFQLDGIASLTDDQELKDLYLSKFPEKVKYDGPEDIFFVFTPTWWRYTDWGGLEGKTILTSEGEVKVKSRES